MNISALQLITCCIQKEIEKYVLIKYANYKDRNWKMIKNINQKN